ncbi:DUF1697 domain-containing protein [soil metagenome]
MPTHVALLRGINVGGRNRVLMADLRALVEQLGHADVATYVASGNVVFASDRNDTAALADELAATIAARLDVTPAAVVLTRGELAAVIDANPYPDVTDGRHLHAVIHHDAVTPDTASSVAEAAQRARDAGSDDSATVIGRVVYLHTPGGMGRSKLAEQLNRGDTLSRGTARNWRTVTRLLEMLDA